MTALVTQCIYEQRSFWRHPLSIVTSVGLTPLIIALLAGITGTDGDLLSHFLPGVLAISVMSTCVTAVSINLSYRRDLNILKRFYATPLSPVVILAGVVISATMNSLLVSAVSLLFASQALGLDLSINLFGFFSAVAAVSFLLAWLGCALSRFPSAAVVAASNAIVYPALFVSGAMFPIGSEPWYGRIGEFLPPHFARQVIGATVGVRLDGMSAMASLAGLGIWAVFGASFSIVRFRWQSSVER